MEDMVLGAKAAAYIAAGIAIGLGTLGPALGQGMVGAKACENIGKYPESSSQIRTIMFFSLAAIETAAIYALLISLGLLYLGSR